MIESELSYYQSIYGVGERVGRRQKVEETRNDATTEGTEWFLYIALDEIGEGVGNEISEDDDGIEEDVGNKIGEDDDKIGVGVGNKIGGDDHEIEEDIGNEIGEDNNKIEDIARRDRSERRSVWQ